MMNESEPEDTTINQAVSEKQLAANRANAMRSTGPRTDEGKEASSRNAVRHGAYIPKLRVIDTGRFDEDPDEVEQNMRAVVAALDPCNDLEHALANRIAMTFVSQSRLDLYEVEAISNISRWIEIPEEPWADPVENGLAHEMIDALTEDGYSPDCTWQSLIVFVSKHRRLGKPRFEVPGVWDQTVSPAGPEGWETVFRALIRSEFDSPEKAVGWAQAHALAHAAGIGRLQAEVAHAQAETALKSTDRVLAARARVNRDLQLLLDQYRKVKAMGLEATAGE